MTTRRRFERALAVASILAAAPVFSGCGQADGTGAPGMPELSDAERAARDDEVASVKERLGEVSCATTPPDATLDVAVTGLMGASSAAGYDHPTCRDAFVVDVTGGTGSGTLEVSTGGNLTNILACLLTVTVETAYEKQGDTYVKIGDAVGFGTIPPPGSSGWVCQAVAKVPVTGPGDYKVIAAAAQLFGPALPVDVSLFPN